MKIKEKNKKKVTRILVRDEIDGVIQAGSKSIPVLDTTVEEVIAAIREKLSEQ